MTGVEVDLTQLYTTIGGVLGTPAAIAICWVINKIKSLEAEVAFLKADNAESKKTLADIRADVSFIRGVLVKTENPS